MAPKLGIVAGGGALPARLADACRAAGREFLVLALAGHADAAAIGDAPQAWIRLGEIATGLRLLHQAGVEEVVLAGPVRRPTLKELRPDWRTARLFGRIGLQALGDDGLLRAVIAEIEAEGFRVIAIDDILADLLAPTGAFATITPDEQGWADIRRGAAVVRGLGDLDIGQAAVVQQGIVLAVEAVEGTDAMIERCAGLRRGGPGGVLVKLRKPGQERRVDLPTIGAATVVRAAAAGLRGIAVEAGGTLVVDRAAVAAAAEAAGLFVVGIDPAAP